MKQGRNLFVAATAAEAKAAAAPIGRTATQDWVNGLTIMQQSVLLGSVRGPDGIAKYHHVKYLLRWYRRCILVSALDGVVLTTPYELGGGSFTGPSYAVLSPELDQDWRHQMDAEVSKYLRSVDELPHHFQLHFMHAVEIVGYKHPDETIRAWWHKTYLRLVHDLHLWPETEEQMDARLGDERSGWLARTDEATAS